MLNQVNIQNFRLFETFAMQGLARVNLIVGKNNVGKSSLLEALYLLVSQNAPDVLLKILEQRGSVPFADSRGRGRTRVYEIAHLFHKRRLHDEATILISGSNQLGTTITFRNKKQAEQLTLLPSEENGQQIRSQATTLHLAYSTSGTQFGWGLAGDVLQAQPIPMLNHAIGQQFKANHITTKSFDYDALARLWDSITLTPKEDDVIELLQILEPTVERINFQTRNTTNAGILIRHQRQDRPVPLGSMGDGMHRILVIATTLANSENGYLFVDEIDTGLHYRTITDMWNVVFKTAERLNVQVFATTHSSDCINSFSEALSQQADPSVGKLFRLERQGDKIAAVEYDHHDLDTATEQEIEVR